MVPGHQKGNPTVRARVAARRWFEDPLRTQGCRESCRIWWGTKAAAEQGTAGTVRRWKVVSSRLSGRPRCRTPHKAGGGGAFG